MNIGDLQAEILAHLGRLEGRLEAAVHHLEHIVKHLKIPQGDAPKTFHVHARKLSTAEPIGGKWKLDSSVTPDMKQGAKHG